MVIFDDVPLFWDAWDVMEYHLETRFCVNVYVLYTVLLNCSHFQLCAAYHLIALKFQASGQAHTVSYCLLPIIQSNIFPSKLLNPTLYCFRCPLLGECVSIQERGPLRAAVSFTLRISKDSTINQVISLEAESPILHFDTQVNNNIVQTFT